MAKLEQDLRSKFVIGAAWVTATRWAIRFVGLVNTIILARLLMPEDFGLIALAMIVVDFIDVWLWLGVDAALVQKKTLTRADYNSAWTMRLIQGGLIAVLVAIAAPFAAEFFKEPRIVAILWVLAPAIFLTSAANIGIVDFQRAVNFRADFIMLLSSKIFSVVVTIALAFWLRSYWALVIGIFSGYLATFIISYIIHPYRPSLCLEKWREFWGFSKWIIVANLGGFLNRKTDEILVGKIASPGLLGIYTIALDLGQMVTNELARPINKVLFPVIANIQEDLARVKRTYLLTISGINTVTMPVGVGLALVAEEFVLTILGEKWLGAVPFLQIFAIYGVLRFTYSGAASVLIALGRVKTNSLLTWYEASFMVGLCLLGGYYYELTGIAYGRAAASIVMAGITYLYLIKYIQIQLIDIVMVLWRPVISVVCMALSIQAFHQAFEAVFWVSLICKMLLGAVVYVSVALFLWNTSGRPDGVEFMVITRVRKFISKGKDA
jgi:lipopolysaccharide exporter